MYPLPPLVPHTSVGAGGVLLPTPNTVDAKGGRRKGQGQVQLAHMAKTGMWPTPAARDWRSGKASQETMDGNSRPLNEVVEHWPTPVGDDTGYRKGKYQQGGTATSTAVGGKLSPSWVEWLMSVPIGWTSLEPLSADAWQRWLSESWWDRDPATLDEQDVHNIPRVCEGVKDRVARLKALGNGIVPAQAARFLREVSVDNH